MYKYIYIGFKSYLALNDTFFNLTFYQLMTRRWDKSLKPNINIMIQICHRTNQLKKH